MDRALEQGLSVVSMSMNKVENLEFCEQKTQSHLK